VKQDFSVFDTAPTAITIADRDADDVPLIYANNAFLSLTGYGLDEIVGRNCRFLQGDLKRGPTVADMKSAIDQGERTSLCLQNLRASGEPFNNYLFLSTFEDIDANRYYLGCQFEFKTLDDIQEIGLDNQSLAECLSKLPHIKQTHVKATLDAMTMRMHAAESRIKAYYMRSMAKQWYRTTM